MNKQIAALITWGFILQLLLGIGSSVFLEYYYQQQSSSIKQLQNLMHNTQLDISQIRYEYTSATQILTTLLIKEKVTQGEYGRDYKKILSHINQASQILNQTSSVQENQEIQAELDELQQLIKLSDISNPNVVKNDYLKNLLPIQQATRKQIVQLTNLVQQKNKLINQQISEISSKGRQGAIAVVLVLWSLGIASALLLKGYINKLLNSYVLSARENKQMLAYSMDIRCFLDKHGQFKKLHRTCESIWGYQETELTGKAFFDYIHPDDKELTKKMWAQIQIDHEVKGFQSRLVHRDGNVMYMSWSVMWSSASKSYFFVGRDETKTVLAEKALRQSQHYAELVIATAHDAFVCIDEESMVIDWNPQAHTIFGWSKQEALGRQLGELIIPERLRERHTAGLKHFMSVKSGPMISKRIELPALHKSGHELLIEITISPIQIDGHYRFSAFMRDVTVAKQVQLELKDAKCLAKAATRAKSEFLANMSHEIRTPMNGVISSTALLLKTPLELEQQQYLTLIKTSADSLLHIFDEILDLSKLEANKLELDLHLKPLPLTRTTKSLS